MNEMINKIKNKYKINDNYNSYQITSYVWDAIFKDKSNINCSTVNIDTQTVDVTSDYGHFKGDYFDVVAWFNLVECSTYYLIFTDNIEKVKEEYLIDMIGKATSFKLTPGLWKPVNTQRGWIFEPINIGDTTPPVLNNDLFADINNEIDMFISKEQLYNDNIFEYKRGILLYGPPGNGKTSFIKSLIKNVDAIIIMAKSNDPDMVEFLSSFLSLSVYDNILKIVIFEDIDGVSNYNRSEFLNLLDGVNRLYKVLFIATTNYPEKLDIGIRDRPSRFDRIINVELPNDKSRELLIKQYFKELSIKDLNYAVMATKGFSGAYFKELFVLSLLLDLSLNQAITEMKKRFTIFNGDYNE